MKADELIDDVARQMTAATRPPMLRARVMTTIGEVRQEPVRTWFMPVAASAAIAALAVAWFVLPSRLVTDETPMAQQAPAIATGPMVVDPAATPEKASAPPAPAPTRRVVAVAAVAFGTWPDETPTDVPTLPPLAGPQPIVIEPVRWNDVTITPLTVALIEVKALAIEPLAPATDSGA